LCGGGGGGGKGGGGGGGVGVGFVGVGGKPHPLMGGKKKKSVQKHVSAGTNGSVIGRARVTHRYKLKKEKRK